MGVISQTPSKDGWYLDEEMGLAEISEAIELYKSGNIKQARGIMCQHFTAREETFSTRLSEQFPERAEIFNAAIGAHLRGEYALSVPVFLAQADGICAQCMGVQLYSKDRKGVSRLAEHQEVKNLDPLLMPFFYPLTAPMPITASQKERFNSFDALNRHAVLHGEDVSYNTQLNSCRALSLLIYTAWVFRELEDFKSSQLKLQTNIEKAKLQPRRNKLIRPD